MKKILTPVGYIEPETDSDTYYFYQSDYQGNIRMVINGEGQILEKNNYYPFGMLFGTCVGESNKQPYKFGGKEYITAKGYNIYDFGARGYDPSTGLWGTPDPLLEKYYSTSPYAYCLNNPVLRIDPDGCDGVITIRGNQITVSANVYLYGTGATKTVVDQMQNDVTAKWGGTYTARSANGSSFEVAIDVKINLYKGKEQSNPAIIPKNWNPFNRDNFVEVRANVKRSYVKGGDEGVWRSQGRNGMTLAKDDPAPHEVGHLLGLKDRYTDKNGANEGWKGNIMGNSRTGTVEQKNIDGILYDAMKAYNIWTQNPKNEREEFRYEINTNTPNN